MHKRFGPAWRCYRGYTRVDDRCVAVAVPEHGYLTAAGYDWKCERGFKEVGTHCKKIVLPENAHLDETGNDWDCHPGYLEVRDKCAQRHDDAEGEIGNASVWERVGQER